MFMHPRGGLKGGKGNISSNMQLQCLTMNMPSPVKMVFNS